MFPGQFFLVVSPLDAGRQHWVLLRAGVWLEQPGEVEDGGVVHKDMEPWPLNHPGPHIVLDADVKLLPEVNLVEPALLPTHWLALLNSVGLEQIQQIEKFLLIC